MRKSVIAILLVVAVLLSLHYASADDGTINLSTSPTEDLIKVRDMINAELERRKANENTKEAKQERYHIINPIIEWVNNYDFDSIIKAIDNGKLEIGESCAADIRNYAEQANNAMNQVSVEKDVFTGNIVVSPANLASFGDNCQAYPYLKNHQFQIVIGFPYETAIHYTDIYWKNGDAIGHTQKSSSKFKIEFERFDGKTWEYSIHSLPYAFDPDGIEAVSFRDSTSVQRYDYTLSEEESTAVANLLFIDKMWSAIQDRTRLWASEGE